MSRPSWMELAVEAAQITCKPFIVGAKPYDKGWFAACGDIEYDGSSPSTAARSVLDELARRAEHQQHESAAAAKKAERQAFDLGQLVNRR